MVTDSLRYNTEVMSTAFADLGTILARELNGFDNQSGPQSLPLDPFSPWLTDRRAVGLQSGAIRWGICPPGGMERQVSGSVRDFCGEEPRLRRSGLTASGDCFNHRVQSPGLCQSGDRP
jgi:hypothetical protein